MANEFASAAQGFLGGAGTGAMLGSAFGPVGTGVGALLGGLIGGVSGGKAAKDVNEGLNALMMIPNVDPMQLAFKDQLLKEKRAVESGFTTDFQVARDIIAKSEAGGMSVAAEMARTNPALALMTMSQVGMGADTAVNKALGTIGARGMGYTQMVYDLVDKISSRKIQVDLMKATTKTGMATKGLSDFNANMNAGMMQLGNVDWGGLFPGKDKSIPPTGTSSFLPMSGFTMDPAVLATDMLSFERLGIGVPTPLINR